MRRAIIVALAVAASASSALYAQIASRGSPPPVRTMAAPPRAERTVPFSVGERLTYDVSWSSYVVAGTASVVVRDKRPSFNSTAYYVVAEARPTPLLAKLYSLYYKLDTLIDCYTLLPQRGSVYSEEGARHRYKTTQFDRGASKVLFEYRADTTVTANFTTSPVAQDALSAFFVLRAIPWKAGDRVTMPVTDNGINYKLQFDVTGQERVRTPAGDRSAWKIRVSVFDNRNVPVGRNVAIWMGDDPRRLPVKLTADLPVGTFNLVLRDPK